MAVVFGACARGVTAAQACVSWVNPKTAFARPHVMMGRLAMLLLLFAGPVLGDLYLHVWTLSLLPHPLPPPVLAFTSGAEQRRGGAGSQMPRDGALRRNGRTDPKGI